jgi:hypothetical protein
MVLARNHYLKGFVTIFLPFVIVLLPHVSVCAEWTVVTPPNVNQYWEVARVHFTSALEGWAVGNHYGADKGSLLHYQNGTWTMVTPPTVSGMWALYGVDFTPTDEGWAVGYSRFNDDSHAGVLLRYQSGVWTSVIPPAVSWNWGLYGVALTSDSEGWAVGRNSDNLIETGVLLHYQNGTWTSITPPTISGTWYLNAVHFTSSDEGWAVGYAASAGVLLHYQSGGWTSVTPPAVSGTWHLNAVHFTSPDEGWAVGYSRLSDDSHAGVLLHYQNGTWTSVAPPTVSATWYLNAVHFTSQNEGWAVGRLGTDFSNYAGVLLHYQSGTWTLVTTPTMSGAWALGGLHFTSTDEGWAVGGDYANLAGALLHYRRGLSPSEGTLGTEISIRGSGFGATKGTVLIGSTSLTIVDWTDGLIRCLLAKPIASGVFDVMILPKEPKGAIPIVEKYAFTVKPPGITSVDHRSGSAYEQVTVTGKFFGTKKGKVYLACDQDGEMISKNCSVTKWWMDPATNESEITFTVPKLVPAVCDVVVDPYGDLPATEESAGYTVQAPEIVSVSPNVGSAEDQVTLSGHFLGAKSSKVYLSFLSNGKPRKKSCPIVAWSNDQIVFKVPKLPPGTYGVIVANSVGSVILEEGFIIK